MKIHVSKLFLDSVNQLIKEEVSKLESIIDKFKYSRFRPNLYEVKIKNGLKNLSFRKTVQKQIKF
jgi:hypothetical protein